MADGYRGMRAHRNGTSRAFLFFGLVLGSPQAVLGQLLPNSEISSPTIPTPQVIDTASRGLCMVFCVRGPEAPRESSSSVGSETQTTLLRKTDPRSPEFIPGSFGHGVFTRFPRYSTRDFVLTTIDAVQPALGSSDAGIYVRNANLVTVPATLYAVDPVSTFVLLLPENEIWDDADFVELQALNQIEVGQPVFTLGFLQASASTPSPVPRFGRILRTNMLLSRRIQGWPEARIDRVTTDSPCLLLDLTPAGTPPGTPLFNAAGQLVGIFDSSVASPKFLAAIDFSSDRQRILRDLAQGYEVEYGFLGVQSQTVPLNKTVQAAASDSSQKTGILVVGIVAGSPAEQAGLSTGDIILGVNQSPMRTSPAFLASIHHFPPESKVTLSVWQAGRNRVAQLEATLSKAPIQNASHIVASRKRHPNWRGIEIDYPTALIFGDQKVIEYYPNGVLVRGVEEASRGARAGLQPGDVITHVDRSPVKTPAEFHRRLRGLSGPVTLRTSTGEEINLGN